VSGTLGIINAIKHRTIASTVRILNELPVAVIRATTLLLIW
jgi:hypothetical protein